jgi:hypothetical protein
LIGYPRVAPCPRVLPVVIHIEPRWGSTKKPASLLCLQVLLKFI